jgi:hypothetical protein
MATDLKYPIGKFRFAPFDAAGRARAIDTIAALPARLRALVTPMTEGELGTPYRPGGWTVRQVANHLPDSHINAYIRFRLALTEDAPRIKPYDEAKWAELPDARSGPVEPSLRILDGLHERWAALLRGMSGADFARTLDHPERGLLTLDHMLGLYAWHCEHHLAHVESVARR